MLLVKWFPYTILLLALIGTSFSLKCKSCEKIGDEFKNCDEPRDCREGDDICTKKVVKGKPSMSLKLCGSSKEKCIPTVGECKTVKISECYGQQSARDFNTQEVKKLLSSDPNLEVEVCACAGDNCNAAFGPAPKLGVVFGSAIIAVGWIGAYRALGI